MIAAKLLKIVFIIQLVLIELDCRCSTYTDCSTCTNHKTWNGESCRWCPLNRSCHAKWSPKNHCLRIKGTRHHSQCETRHPVHYNSDEAYRLLMFATAAYSDTPEKCLSALLPNTDYTVKSTIILNCDDFLFNYDKQCLAFIAVSHKNKEIVVAFRGTRGIKQIIDQVLTIMVTPAVHSTIGGKVFRYFNNVHGKLYETIKHSLNELMHRHAGYLVKLTGHSLGGAAASITSALLVQDGIVSTAHISLYTFGMPRVGNKIYARIHDKLVPNSWRVVRNGDIVANLPSCPLGSCLMFDGPYHHGRKIIYTDEDMRRYSQHTVCNGNEDTLSQCDKKYQNRSTVTSAKMEFHKEYFGIPVGTYCRDHIMKNQ